MGARVCDERFLNMDGVGEDMLRAMGDGSGDEAGIVEDDDNDDDEERGGCSGFKK